MSNENNISGVKVGQTNRDWTDNSMQMHRKFAYTQQPKELTRNETIFTTTEAARTQLNINYKDLNNDGIIMTDELSSFEKVEKNNEDGSTTVKHFTRNGELYQITKYDKDNNLSSQQKIENPNLKEAKGLLDIFSSDITFEEKAASLTEFYGKDSKIEVMKTRDFARPVVVLLEDGTKISYNKFSKELSIENKDNIPKYYSAQDFM